MNARNEDMKVNKKLQKKRGKAKNKAGNSLGSFFMVSAVGILAIAFAIGSKFTGLSEQDQVYAATGKADSAAENTSVPTGIAGIIDGISEAPLPGSTVNRLGTSFEKVVVGQRVQKVESAAVEINVSESMELAVNDLDSKASELAANPKIMSDEDYDTLLRIVEAEAGTEDMKGRILVGNVIMNRVKHEKYPDTVTEVVWEYVDGVPQFSPVYDGRIDTVVVSDETREAVRQILEGVDYSDGALFFIMKSAAESHNIQWFEKDLEFMFKHGVHEFYKYPDENGTGEPEKNQRAADKDIVQMVKLEEDGIQ